MNNTIVTNQIKCNICGDTPYSAHVHDFKWCACERVACDGGTHYLKRTGEGWEDISIVIPDDKCESLIQTAQEMIDSGRNARGIVYGVLREMRDMGIDVNNVFADKQEEG